MKTLTVQTPLVKGQLISKANCQAVNSSKNEQMNSFLLVCDVFSFVFGRSLDSQAAFRNYLTFTSQNWQLNPKIWTIGAALSANIL